jgi:hypothetical protein
MDWQDRIRRGRVRSTRCSSVRHDRRRGVSDRRRWRGRGRRLRGVRRRSSGSRRGSGRGDSDRVSSSHYRRGSRGQWRRRRGSRFVGRRWPTRGERRPRWKRRWGRSRGQRGCRYDHQRSRRGQCRRDLRNGGCRQRRACRRWRRRHGHHSVRDRDGGGHIFECRGLAGFDDVLCQSGNFVALIQSRWLDVDR